MDGVYYQVIDGKLYRYANLTMDKAFKIVLGRIGSEDVLRNLLNRMLGTKIVRLEYRNTEHPGMTEEERASRFDVYCEDEDGTCFQVEMQNWSQKHFNKRAVYYSSLVTRDQAVKAQRAAKEKNDGSGHKWDYDFQSLYVVGFMNYKNWTAENTGNKRNEYISIYRYRDIETGSELGDGTNIVFIDLHRFTKTIDECISMEDIWMYSIKNMFTLHSCPEKVRGTEIEDLFMLSELAKMTPELRIKIEEEFMTQNDILNSIAEQIEDARKIAIEEGMAKGMAEGMEKGMAEGRAEGHETGRKQGQIEAKYEDAGKLKKLGVSPDIISQATGLSIEIIDSL